MCDCCYAEPYTDHWCYAYGNSRGNVPQSWAETDTCYTQWVSWKSFNRVKCCK